MQSARISFQFPESAQQTPYVVAENRYRPGVSGATVAPSRAACIVKNIIPKSFCDAAQST